jgi:ribonucleoside-diphosphate reductase alpha chain
MSEALSTFANTILEGKYLKGEESDWRDIAGRVVGAVVGPHFPELVDPITEAIANREFMPGGRYLANAGYSNMLNNCFLYRVGDSKEEIADFYRKGTVTGMTGGGVGAVWSDLRPRGAAVKSNGGTSTGPCAFMYSFNEIGRGVVNGGSRRMAIWAGLHWWHPDVFEFMALKDWDEDIVARKAADFSAYASMDMTNISVILDDDFFTLINGDADEVEIQTAWGTITVDRDWAERVYWTAVEKMLNGGEPGFSVDLGENKFENLRNPCCEITSEDDSDVCCLGSINMARIDTIERMAKVTELGTVFLLCGTLESDVPHEEVRVTREKNRRLGLGLMGIHEWLIQRGYSYDPNDELAEWLDVWQYASDGAAAHYSWELSISQPKKVRAIAPTGTIGIIAETTTGIEPLFAAGYKRRYLDNGVWKYQYVVDATAQRMVEQYGIDPDEIETAYDLANDPGRRLRMQAFVQQFVDHAISSTLNLPSKADQLFTTEEFGYLLLNVLPRLRGVTVYPDGSRGGQPLNVVSYQEATDWAGFEYEEVGLDQACVGGVCGV